MVTLTTNLINPIHSGAVTVRGAWQRLSMLLTVMLLSATTAWAENVSYKDADGTIKYVDATVLDGSKAILPSGCYVVKGNVSYDYGLSFGGNVQLILADGASLTVNTSSGDALTVGNGSLTIYGQAQGTGQLHVSGTGGDGIFVSGTLTIYGGSVETSSTDGDGIYAQGDITVNGGSVKASSTNRDGIFANGHITLNGGTVKSSSYNGYVLVASGLAYIDEDGTMAMTLNTASSGFNTATGELTLYFDDVTAGNTISGGTPFIVKWSKPDGYTADGGFDITNPVFSDITVVPSVTDVTSEDGYVSFVGNFSPVTFTDGSNSVLYLGAGNNVYWPNATMAINANRAYFQLNGITAGTPTANVRSLVLTFGDADTQPAETTAIAHTSAAITDSTGKADAWYTLDGRKLQGKPTQRGMYINNGGKSW